ncbi:MAG: hypothetical protein GEV09_05605 [Pseudonocardiaceae bacterium]|nr:hypothetical protein [Pseudonocardiaceae bacterium]
MTRTRTLAGPLLLEFPTPAQRRLLDAPRRRSVTYAGLAARHVAVGIAYGRVAVMVTVTAGHTVDLTLPPADAVELRAALLSHAEWAAPTR